MANLVPLLDDHQQIPSSDRTRNCAGSCRLVSRIAKWIFVVPREYVGQDAQIDLTTREDNPMDSGKLCPRCKKDIGIWPVFSAGMPNRIWCPHCRARLRYRDAGGMLAVTLVAATVFGFGAYLGSGVLAQGRWGYERLLYFAGLMLVAACLVELVVTLRLRSSYELEDLEAPKSEFPDDQIDRT